MSRLLFQRVVVGAVIAVGVLVGSGGQATAAQGPGGSPIALASLASKTAVVDQPPLGNDSEGKPYAPCGPENDGQRYMTVDSQGYPREYICSRVDDVWGWLEIFRA